MASSSSVTDCDWASFELELGLEDVDSNMKEETPLLMVAPDVSGSFFPSSTFPSTEPDKKDEDEVSQQQASCPCCKENIDLSQSNYHSHVSTCFMEKQKDRKRQKIDNRNMASCIDSIRQNLSRMDLRQRINLMDSLGRLAHSTSLSSPFSVPARSQKDDNFLISLLYSEPKERKAQPPPLKIECDFPSFPQSESCTPTLAAAECGSLPNYSLSSTASMTPGQAKYINSKRKRDVVQALSFSPDAQVAQPNPFKFTRLEL